ncbi:MAG: DUF5908 family protein [Bacteroidota bacterium]
MPLEIKELIIKASVDDKSANKSSKKSTGRTSMRDRQLIIDECMARVKELLKEIQER